MPILRYTASADTTITDAFKPYTTNRAYYANMGAADSLEIFSVFHSGSASEKSRILIDFPIENVVQNRISGAIPASGSVSFILKLSNVQHPETLPANYDVLIKPISGSWDEGSGLDLENYTDNGQTQDGGFGANWKFKSTTDEFQIWAVEGGDFYPGYDKTFHFETGLEDLEVDVTDIVEQQITGAIRSDGFAIMLSGNFENGLNYTNYYTKRFSARSSEYFYKVPCLEARWETTLKDDRGNFFFYSPNLDGLDNNQNIYFYNRINGTLRDLPSAVTPYVKVLDENSVELTSSIQSQKVATGTYRASFYITGSEDAILSDQWYSGSSIYFIGEINAKVREFSDSSNIDEHIFTITNLKKEYKTYEKPNIKIFGRNKGWSPNIYKIAVNEVEAETFNNLYYKIIRAVDNETILDYGINPIAYTKCSYDKNGNYFDLDMSILEPGYAYAIKLMLLNGDTKVELPNTYRFKVE